jgi:hypothetical protein
MRILWRIVRVCIVTFLITVTIAGVYAAYQNWYAHTATRLQLSFTQTAIGYKGRNELVFSPHRRTLSTGLQRAAPRGDRYGIRCKDGSQQSPIFRIIQSF